MWPLRQARTHGDGVPLKKLERHRAIDEWVPELTGEPLRPRQRPMSPLDQHLLHLQVQEWLHRQVIEPIRTQELNNNIVLAAKKNGTWRVCDDCTPVNAVTKDYDWPLPRLQDVRYRVRGSRYFTRLDLKDAFFRIRVPAPYRRYTAFTSRGQQYQFTRMPFGLKTAPAIFQQFMDTKLSPLSRDALWYIDDILLHAESIAELRRRTKRMTTRLRQIGCTVNDEKSEYEKTGILFAGIFLFSTGLGPNREQLARLSHLPPPTNKKEMQSALGLVSYLRDFIPLVAHFTSHLYPTQTQAPLTAEHYALEWGKLIRHLRSAATTLRHWQENEDADLFTDASKTGLGVIVIQHGRIVAVSSRKLTPAETRYSATDREHLGLYHAARRFRVFLHRPTGVTRVHSDHAALIGRNQAEMTPRQTRWLNIVNQWIPNVTHVPGPKNPADYISRWGLEIFGGAEKL